MELLKTSFLSLILIGSLTSASQSMSIAASITPQKSTEFPTIEFVDTDEPEYDIQTNN